MSKESHDGHSPTSLARCGLETRRAFFVPKLPTERSVEMGFCDIMKEVPKVSSARCQVGDSLRQELTSNDEKKVHE